MQTDAPLTGRRQEILHSIVRAYMQTGDPVGSHSLARLRHNTLSPASLRNEMAALVEEGYLSQPHTSAGRVPTLKAVQDYVDSLDAARMPLNEAERIRSEMSGAGSMEDRLERSSRILMELTRSMAIAAAIPGEGLELDQIELLPLADQRVLMIVVTRDRVVRHRVVSVEDPVSPADLTSIRNYVNRSFGGWLVEDARRELLRRIAEDRALYDAVLSKLHMLYLKGLLDIDSSPEVRMEGAANLVGLDLHLTREKMRDLLRALEEKKRLVDLLDRFLDQPGGRIEVRVGLADVHPDMQELSLIGLWLRTPSGISAKLAVLGPVRMPYEKVMAAVLHMGRAFERC